MAIFVNQEKVKRAQDILSLLARLPKSPDEIELKNKYTAILSTAGINPSDETALGFVYEKLGGLVRTEEEQAEFEVKVAPLKKKK